MLQYRRVKVDNDNHFHLKHVPDIAPEAPAMQRLSRAPLNRWVRIDRLEGPEEDCDRLLDLGLTPGEEVSVTHAAPLGDPLIVRVRGALLALRKREAAWIWVGLG
jgi:ferrous iron transport protein A